SVSEAVAASATTAPKRRDFFMDASSLWWMVHRVSVPQREQHGLHQPAQSRESCTMGLHCRERSNRNCY
ncbi:hypothetical protein, partial [Agromyces humatus]